MTGAVIAVPTTGPPIAPSGRTSSFRTVADRTAADHTPTGGTSAFHTPTGGTSADRTPKDQGAVA